MTQTNAQRLGRARLVVLAVTTAGGLGVLAALLIPVAGGRSQVPWPAVATFAVFLVAVTNFSAVLDTEVKVTPDLMVVMVAVAAFRADSGVLAAALVGLSGGLMWDVLTTPSRPLAANLLMTSFNCSQLMLAAAAAALTYRAVDRGTLASVLVAAGAAALAYAVVNMALVLASTCTAGVATKTAWANMAPELPNFFAFGVVGALVGQLYSMIGVLSLVLLIVPSVIARRTYRSSLELREARDQTIAVFMKALEVKDVYTARHTRRVAMYSCYIGEELGFRPNRLDDLRQAALMHDIGKLAVSSRLLNKPGRLTEEEYGEIKRHNEVCVEILTQVEFLRATIPVATDRHGFFDASAAGADAVALHGYIVAVADAFDAMTSTRAYRKALPQHVAFAELQQGKGSQFHPACVDALIAAIERRGETFGAGHERDPVEFEVEPPASGVGSAGLGDLERPRPKRLPTLAERASSVPVSWSLPVLGD